MRERAEQDDLAPRLSGKERGAIEEFLAFIEERVRDVEPVCAELVRRARLALAEPQGCGEPGRHFH